MLTSFDKLEALMQGVTRKDILELPPLHRQRLAQVLRYIADLADPPARQEQTKPGGLPSGPG